MFENFLVANYLRAWLCVTVTTSVLSRDHKQPIRGPFVCVWPMRGLYLCDGCETLSRPQCCPVTVLRHCVTSAHVTPSHWSHTLVADWLLVVTWPPAHVTPSHWSHTLASDWPGLGHCCWNMLSPHHANNPVVSKLAPFWPEEENSVLKNVGSKEIYKGDRKADNLKLNMLAPHHANNPVVSKLAPFWPGEEN